MKLEIHPNLSKKKFIIELSLCLVYLENNRHFPWLILVPKRADTKKIMDLSVEDQILLIQELDVAQKILWELFSPTQLNVAAIGNKTPQLHIHVIARVSTDPAWPNTVWDHPNKEPYSEAELNTLANTIQASFILRQKRLLKSSCNRDLNSLI